MSCIYPHTWLLQMPRRNPQVLLVCRSALPCARYEFQWAQRQIAVKKSKLLVLKYYYKVALTSSKKLCLLEILFCKKLAISCFFFLLRGERTLPCNTATELSFSNIRGPRVRQSTGSGAKETT